MQAWPADSVGGRSIEHNSLAEGTSLDPAPLFLFEDSMLQLMNICLAWYLSGVTGNTDYDHVRGGEC